MNFTPVLDEIVVCKIAPTHHKNTELDHFQSPINLTKFLNGGVAEAFFTPPSPRFRPGRRGPGRFWRHAATSKSSIPWTNAARSMGARAVTILPSVIGGSSIH